jgi:TRAP-type C4-dicarboxylate transport system substrate-binding protein
MRCTVCPMLGIALFALATAGFVDPAAAQPAARELKLSIAVGPAFALGKAGARWAALVGERSGGTLAVKVHPGATLAQRDPAREFAALASGGAELAVGSTLQWAAQVPELGVVGLPWLAPGPGPLASLAAEPFSGRLVAALQRAGVVALAFAPLGHRALATSGRLVKEPADLAGLAVRVPAVPALVDFYATLEAKPQVLEFAAAQAAFRSGALGAQDGNAASFVAARLEAVGLRHVVDWHAVGEIAVFGVNRQAWEGWTDAQRALTREAAATAAAELALAAREETTQALAELRQRGVTLIRMTPDGHAAFAAAGRVAYLRAAALAGDEIVRAAEETVRAVAR